MKAQQILIIFLILVIISSGEIFAENTSKLDGPHNIPHFLGYVAKEFIVVLKEDAPLMTFQPSKAGFIMSGRDNFDAVGKNFMVKRIKKQFPLPQDHRVINNLSTTPTRKKLANYYKVRFENGTLTHARSALIPAVSQ